MQFLAELMSKPMKAVRALWQAMQPTAGMTRLLFCQPTNPACRKIGPRSIKSSRSGLFTCLYTWIQLQSPATLSTTSHHRGWVRSLDWTTELDYCMDCCLLYYWTHPNCKKMPLSVPNQSVTHTHKKMKNKKVNGIYSISYFFTPCFE